MSRRDDVIFEATALLREDGPDSLTSGNVAARLGVTQSAIYRHVHDMNELTTIASNAVVAELDAVMSAAVVSPETTWGDGADIAHFADRLVRQIREHGQAFAVIERWRYDDGELGAGIRELLVEGRDLVAVQLEAAFRDDFDISRPFDMGADATQTVHAQLIIDDVIAIARLVRTTPLRQRKDTSRLLGLRLFACWCAYVLDMTHRMGLPTPALGSSTLSAPMYSSR